jgi:heme exporter protein D
MSEATIAAFWSAVAASFSALAAVAAILIQRRNLLDSVRPELVLTGWARQARVDGDSARDIVTVRSIKNVGRGPALHVNINGSHFDGNRPVALMSTIRMPILAPNEEMAIEGEIVLWWKNVAPESDGPKMLPVNIRIYSWDSRNMRHETRYSLAAFELQKNHFVADGVAPGLMLMTRGTISRPVWVLKLCSRLARLPLMGRAFGKIVSGG